MITSQLIILVLCAYLIGSFPSAVWIGKLFYNKDVREYGSGNAGATNTFRVLGVRAGLPVLLIDIFKGWLSVNLILLFNQNINSSLNVDRFFEIQLVLALSAVLGHLFPIYTGFRGGKGIATMLGVLIGILPIAALGSSVIFLIFLLLFRYVSLASIIASICFPLIAFLFLEIDNDALNLFVIFVPILSLITHQKNIEKLFKGEETKVKFGKK
tara:strand:- start:249 stop:887 length:639 start_codon:yes stop_codon:yes gene_type:complete